MAVLAGYPEDIYFKINSILGVTNGTINWPVDNKFDMKAWSGELDRFEDGSVMYDVVSDKLIFPSEGTDINENEMRCAMACKRQIKNVYDISQRPEASVEVYSTLRINEVPA